MHIYELFRKLNFFLKYVSLLAPHFIKVIEKVFSFFPLLIRKRKRKESKKIYIYILLTIVCHGWRSEASSGGSKVKSFFKKITQNSASWEDKASDCKYFGTEASRLDHPSYFLPFFYISLLSLFPILLFFMFCSLTLTLIEWLISIYIYIYNFFYRTPTFKTSCSQT